MNHKRTCHANRALSDKRAEKEWEKHGYVGKKLAWERSEEFLLGNILVGS